MKKQLKIKQFSKQILKGSLFYLLIFSPVISNAYAEEKLSPENFNTLADITGNIKKDQISSVYLSENLLEKSKNDFKDIRVFDAKSQEVPYILIDEHIPEDKPEMIQLDIADYYQQNNQDIVICKINNKLIPSIEKISFSTSNTDFNKKIKIYGSDNKNNWQYIIEGNIYDYLSKISLRNTSITFKKEAKFKYYKFEIQNLSQSEKESMLKLNYKGLDLSVNENDNQTFRIDNIQGETYSKNKEITAYDKKTFKPVIENKDKKSIIYLKNILDFNTLNFDIGNPYYYREVNVYSGDKEQTPIIKDYIYDIGNNENEEKKQINLNSLNSKNLRIEILNYDNPPLAINSITSQRIKKNLFFIPADNTTYKLYIGNKDVEAPVYDISSYINQYNWYKTKYDTLQISSISENKDFKPGFSKDEQEKLQKNILVGVVLLIVVLLGFWIYRMMKDVNTKNTNA